MICSDVVVFGVVWVLLWDGDGDKEKYWQPRMEHG